MFKALLLEKGDAFSAAVKEVDEAGLPAGDVTVKIEYSTLNYKDGLAITNRGPVVRQWPMVAGIDGAGTVLASSHPAWQAGDAFDAAREKCGPNDEINGICAGFN